VQLFTKSCKKLQKGMKVYKFGGASVKEAAGVRNLAEIARNTEGRLFIVV
jgi:aspartate kinase